MDRLKGKVAVVTGAASGIGAGTARLFHAEGASVILADMQEGPGAALAKALGARAHFVRADVTSEADVAAAVDAAVAKFGALDIMINNAGIVGAVGSIANTPLDDWNRTISILLTGVFLGMKHAARVMIPNKRGAIVSVASTAGVLGGLVPTPTPPPSTASSVSPSRCPRSCRSTAFASTPWRPATPSRP